MGVSELAAEQLSDEEVNNDLTKSEMSQDQLFCACCDISSKSECPVEKIREMASAMAPLLGLFGARPPHAVCGRRARKDAVTRKIY